MKIVVKRIRTIVGMVILLLLIIIVISFINHKIQLSKEDRIFIPNGKIVQVNKHEIHIYTEGQGNETLVFMSGGGTCSPVLDFKSLYSLLSDKYRIAVVEKLGYGFSKNVDVNRDIHTILEQTRESLSKLGLQGPYILFPHSMSGIEALYWAQQYPKEVKAIVGLDMVVPPLYQDYRINHFMLSIGQFASNIGITRFLPSIANSSSAIKDGKLTEKEKILYRAIFYRRTLTKPMFKEVNAIKTNAEKVNKDGIPDVPMLSFISNGEGTGWNKDKWIEIQTLYLQNAQENRSIKLNCGHYIHNVEYKKIAEESKDFIENIK